MEINEHIDFATASFKEFENIAGFDMMDTAKYFHSYINYMKENQHLNFRFVTQGCGPTAIVSSPFLEQPTECISLVSNDYLNFSQHPKVKAAAIAGIEKYGTGAGASPLIGGTMNIMLRWRRRFVNFSTDQRDRVSFLPPDIQQTVLLY
ncbi:hypothetical protein KUH03_42340 [Sphingobacterium sp. E70]|uniref:hypothetical protein n=1 Tax=Sphingobacterium sp. E70 TaxID=2853439 RepID=UPI00211BFAAA|nr:hypothetical protein [Sphingobacterium sp. E70]ULT25352.1 hypothetical protein KUH03_42340 [Sphingobacterium sp. E70]